MKFNKWNPNKQKETSGQLCSTTTFFALIKWPRILPLSRLVDVLAKTMQDFALFRVAVDGPPRVTKEEAAVEEPLRGAEEAAAEEPLRGTEGAAAEDPD